MKRWITSAGSQCDPRAGIDQSFEIDVDLQVGNWETGLTTTLRWSRPIRRGILKTGLLL